MSMSLLSVVAQQLIPTKDGKRTLACEVMIANQAIRAVIRENNIHQIDNYIKSGGNDGMILMDDSLIELYQNGIINKKSRRNENLETMSPSKQKYPFNFEPINLKYEYSKWTRFSQK